MSSGNENVLKAQEQLEQAQKKGVRQRKALIFVALLLVVVVVWFSIQVFGNPFASKKQGLIQAAPAAPAPTPEHSAQPAPQKALLNL